VQGENQGQGSSSKVQGENQGQGSSSKVQGENQVQGSSSKVQDKASNYRAELEISEDAVVALYSGNMGGKQGLEILAQVAKIQVQEARCKWQETRFKAQETRFKAQDTRFKAQAKQSERSLAPCTLPLVPEIIFVFCGNGAGRAELVVLCEGLGNVRFLDLQPLERLGELLSFADIHLLPQRADAADLVMPSKLTGMLASGRPVVATANEGTELANVVSGCGMVVPPEQPHAFLDAIMILAKDAELRRQLGCAGRAYAVANLDRDAVLGRFEAELKAVTRCKIQGID
jgi:colanic acid biosynthesis glycosyl transferase WcaI